MSSNAAAYSAALQQLGIVKNTPTQISEFEMAPCTSDMFNANWSSHPGNNRFNLSADVTREFQSLYMAGKGKKKTRQITVDKAYYILVDTVIKYDWLQTMTLSVAKIKPLFL